MRLRRIERFTLREMMRKAPRALEVPRLLRLAHQTQRVFGAEEAWIVNLCLSAPLR